MERLSKEVVKEKNFCEYILKVCDDFLNKAPTGSLYISKGKNAVSYFHVPINKKEDLKGNSRKRIYIPKSNLDLAYELAQKDYYQKARRVAKRRLHQLNRFRVGYQPNEIEDVYNHLSDHRKKLVKPFDLPYDEYARIWDQESYKKRVFEPDTPEIYTERGERVLSKSEKIIADKLYMLGIHYRYEYPLVLGEKIMLPDFTLLHPLTREEWIWEHMGMMNDMNYVDRNMKKLKRYERHGYYPGVNMIITSEIEGYPLNMRIVEDMLRLYGFIENDVKMGSV